ncbi:MAG TPA: response regulator [Verrucomicrobiae bacterium]|nr:response regulator [Verrucomicrobiae bacterium]
MERVLIVEDQSSDARVAADLVASLGAANVEARTSASAAKAYLQSALDGKASLPDVLIVDLDLGYESGFELLRFWHGSPDLAKVRLIVWTCMGEEQQEICRLFKVSAIVSKSEGVTALKRALETGNSSAS